ncbi:hypothetical protein FA95DRAFT_127237 [Auriscalpium vulgare]|uniref:Uncharacterized protein n=1 Tax=Auriscalpium vulgare TaxID=40419 RepID=A0ACB8RMN0_9AGAM|nr:hypothetical protein FA95DRAFT_127237 [Auriscalpium vulgare]
MSFMTSSPPISRLTNEILQKIFSKTIPERSWFELEPNSELTQFALVSKRWADVAKRELLTHLYLSESSDEAKRLKSVRDMLRTSPASANIIRGIHFGSWLADEEEIENILLGEILTLCPNLVEVSLQGYMHSTTLVIQALAACTKLKKVYISDTPMENQMGCDPFCTVPQFLTLLQGWPAIESVTLSTRAIGSRGLADQEEEEEVVAKSTWVTIANSCPLLTRFECPCYAATRDQYFLALSEIAPSLSSLEFDNSEFEKSPMTESTLVTIFNRWSANMTTLTITHSTPDPDPKIPSPAYYSARLDPILSAMPLLRELSLPSSYLSPSSLSRGFGALAVLQYEIWAEEMAAMAFALREEGSMPALRRLKVTLRQRPRKLSSKSKKLLEDLRVVCKSRGIDFNDERLHDY